MCISLSGISYGPSKTKLQQAPLVFADASYRIFFLFFSFLSNTGSRLRDVESLTDHEASMGHKDQSGRVELEYRTFSNDTEGNLIVDPTLADPVGNDGDDA